MGAETGPAPASAPEAAGRPPAASSGGRIAAVLVSLVVSALGLGYAFGGIEWTGFWKALRTARYPYILAAVVVGIGTHLIRAWRWRFLFGLRRPRFSDTAVANFLGFFFLAILPLRIGEVVRPWVVSRRTGIPFLRCLATATTERTFDAATILLLLFGSVLFLPPGVPAADALGVEIGGVRVLTVFTSLFLVFIAALLVVVFAEPLAARAARALLGPFPRIRDAVVEAMEHFAGGLRASAESPAGLAAVVLGSIVLWTAMSFSYWIALAGFADSAGAIAPRVGFAGATFLMGVVGLAVAAPAAPGFIGTFQAGCVVALGLLGVESAAAAAFSIVIHVAHFVPILLIGGGILPWSGVRFSDARAAAGPSPAS